VANYNWIMPNQFNDMHTTLSGGYKGLTGDAVRIKQGDDLLTAFVPLITASQAYQDNGAIFLWWDESEGTNANDLKHTINYTHSSTLRTLQEIYGVGPFLGDAAAASDLSGLFKPGVIPSDVPPGVLAEPGRAWTRRTPLESNRNALVPDAVKAV
jgi:hypothetical protein